MGKKVKRRKEENILIRGIRVDGDIKEETEKIMKIIEMQGMKIEKVRRVGGRRNDGKGLVVVELESIELKRNIMEARRKLKERDERINDLMWKERKMQ